MFLPFFYICELRDPSAPRCFSSIALPLAVRHGKEKSPGIFLPFQGCLSLQRPQECLLVQVFRILPVHAELQAEPVDVCAEFIYASLDFPRLQSLTSIPPVLFSPYIRRQFRIGSFFCIFIFA